MILTFPGVCSTLSQSKRELDTPSISMSVFMSKKTTIVSIAGALSIPILGLAFLYIKKSSFHSELVSRDQSQSVSSPEGVLMVADSADWETYRSNRYGFEVQYPSNIYTVKDKDYIPMISFVAKTDDLKRVYGDIQVYVAPMGSSSEGSAPLDRSFLRDWSRIHIGSNDVFLSKEKQSCGAGEGYCPIPGEAIIFLDKKDWYYDIRRITFDGYQFSTSKGSEMVFQRFLDSLKIF